MTRWFITILKYIHIYIYFLLSMKSTYSLGVISFGRIFLFLFSLINVGRLLLRNDAGLGS